MSICKALSFCAISLLIGNSIGCSSGRYPVTGKVVYPDGSAVDGGTVVAEATIEGKIVAVQSNIEKDGSYALGAASPGDGALPGSYRAAVMSVALGDSELAAGKTPSVDGKFSKLETSGITLDVKPQKNTIDIQVTKPKSK